MLKTPKCAKMHALRHAVVESSLTCVSEAVLCCNELCLELLQLCSLALPGLAVSGGLVPASWPVVLLHLLLLCQVQPAAKACVIGASSQGGRTCSDAGWKVT